YGWDSDNVYQEAEKNIGVVYGPSKPVIYNFYPGGGSISLSFLSSGASSYKIFYDINSGHPYNGTEAIEGNSPIDVGSENTFTLTGLSVGVPYYLNIKGYNSEGESVYAEEVVVKPITTAGVLPADEVWYGRINISDYLAVPPEITLTILPGTEVFFSEEAALFIFGSLNAAGLSTNKIIFDRNGTYERWNYIAFYNSTSLNSVLDNVVVKNATEIRCINNANITIKNSLIENCYHGIYIYGSQPQILNNLIIEPYGNGIYGEASGKSPLIKGNKIKKTSGNPQYHHYQGIYLYGSTNPFITANDIQGFDYGIYYGGNGSGALTDNNFNTPFINNRFADNRYGLTVAWGSYLIAGIEPADRSEYTGHRNSIWG